MKQWVSGVLMVGAFFSAADNAQAETLNLYHIGNSVTDTIRYEGLKALAVSRGHTHNWGRSMIPGAPLAWHWTHPTDAISEPPYGQWPTALPNYAWDAMTLQPFDRQLGNASNPVPTTPGTTASENDIPIIRGYINLALQNTANPNTQFYVYSRWPRRDESGGNYLPFDYQAKWNRTYTGGWDGTNESRDYFQDLTDGLNTINLGLNKPIRIVPVGDVLYELDRRMEAGSIPGYSDIVEVYEDGIHFNNVGSYVVALTFYATLYRDNPAGMGIPSQWNAVQSYDRAITPAQAAQLQDAVWSVVAGHPYSGVPVPEPTSLALIGTSGLLLMRRRRVNCQ